MADTNIKAGIQIVAEVAGQENITRLVQAITETSGETSELSEQAQKLAQEWQQAQDNQALIAHYRSLKSALADNRTEITQTEQQMRQLNAEMQNGATKAQEKQYKHLQNQLTNLNQQKRQLLTNLRDTSTQMNQVGINTKNLADKQKQFAEQANKAEQELKQLNQEAQRLQQIAKNKAVLGLDVDDRARQEINQLNQAYRDLKRNGGLTKAELARATQAYQAKLKELNGTLEQSGHQMTPMAQSITQIGMKAAGAVGGLAALQKGLSDVLAATQEYQAIATRFTYAFGGAEEGAKQLAFVRDEANRLGLEMMGAANGYAQFAAAAKDLNISTEQTQSIFKGVASAAATMGLSADDANGVFLALSQIAGKGKVSMEELRGQLGERLAPAMSIAAKAMGVTTTELEKMVENGLAAETFLPRFGAALEEAFGADAATNVQSLSGQINLLKNSYNEFLIKLGEGSVGAGMVAVMKDIGAALEFAKVKFDEFSQSENGKLLQENFSQFYELIKEIGSTIFQVFQTAKDSIEDFSGAFSSAISGSKNEMDLLQAVLDGANLTMAAMRDGVVAVGIEFEIFAGMAKHFLSFMAEGLSKITFGDWSASLKQAAADLNLAAKDNYRQANEMAMNFESHTAKVWQSMVERANNTSQATEQATTRIKESVDETAKAEAKAQELSQAYKDAQTAVSGFGLDMRAAMNEATPAMAEAQSNLAKLVAGFDDLKAKGVNASLLLNQALEKMTKTATNQADIDALKQNIRSLGQSGLLSMQEVERAILAADIRLQELKGTIDPTEAAFKKLGIQTKEAMRLSAEETRLAFEAVKSSGQATSDDLKKAFEQTANDLLATGDSNQRAWVESQAAAYDYKVTVDSTGKAALQSAADTKAASDQKVAAHKQEEAAAKQVATANQQAAESTEKSVQAIEKEGKALNELGQKVAQSMNAIKGWRHLGTPMWASLIKNLQDMHIDINRTIKQLNADMENGGNLAKSLAHAEAHVLSNAHKLDKVTLSNLNSAIAKARQQMQALADEAANAQAAAEKRLLQAQGKDDEVQKMEQQAELKALREQQEKAQKMGNKEAVASYQRAITDTQKAFEEERQRQAREREQQQREEAERQREQEQRQREQMLNVSAMPVDVNVQTDLGDFITTLKQHDDLVADKAANQAVKNLISKLQDALSQQR